VPTTASFSNYRTFVSSAPLILPLDRTLIAFLGPNNSGKSGAIRALYDFRNLLAHVVNMPNLIVTGAPFKPNGPPSRPTYSEAFTTLNDEAIQIVIRADINGEDVAIHIQLSRTDEMATVLLTVDSLPVPPERPITGDNGADLRSSGATSAPMTRTLKLQSILSTLRNCTSTIYTFSDGGGRNPDDVFLFVV
jgi:hypothetical protein